MIHQFYVGMTSVLVPNDTLIEIRHGIARILDGYGVGLGDKVDWEIKASQAEA